MEKANVKSNPIKNTEINMRLQNSLEKLGMSPGTLAKQTGIDPSNLAKMVKGKMTISIKTLRAIERNSPISSYWLQTGRGEMFKEYSPEAEMGMYDRKGMKPRITNYANAGTRTEPLEQSVEEYMPVIRQLPDYDATIVVHGDSMEPTYHSGDEIAVKDITMSGFRQWGSPHILNTMQGILIKRIFPDKENKGIKCISDNKEYPPFTVPENEIYRIYKIVGVIRME